MSRHIVVGKHSGVHGLIERYRKMGITVARGEAERLLSHVRTIAQNNKRALSDRELFRLYAGTSTFSLAV